MMIPIVSVRLMVMSEVRGSSFIIPLSLLIQVLQVRELIEVKEVITPYGRSGS